jgi:carbonic anhydrase
VQWIAIIMEEALADIFKRNRIWAQQRLETDSDYFRRLVDQQSPDFLWIGCADSRVPANVIAGMEPGEVFVHRNIANVVSTADMNVMAVVQFAIEQLRIRHIIICGHYGCGGVRAALEPPSHGLVDLWLDSIRETARRNHADLAAYNTEAARVNRLCELNVHAQVHNLSYSTVLQQAWARGDPVTINGLVYNLQDGLLHDLGCSVTGAPAA